MKYDYPLSDNELNTLFNISKQIKDSSVDEFLTREYGSKYTGVKSHMEELLEERIRNGIHQPKPTLRSDKSIFKSTKYLYKHSDS